MTTQLITQPYHLPREAGPARWHLGALLTFKATSEQTAGRLWAKELLAERGMATPMHRHSREDEAFYVLDGEVSVYVGEEVVRARAGRFPLGTARRPARLLRRIATGPRARGRHARRVRTVLLRHR